MRTSDVMSRPVVTVGPDTQIKHVAATLIEHGINAVPVVDHSGRLVGIVSEADLLMPQRDSAVGRRLPRTAGHVMSQSVYTVTEDTDPAATARMMLRHHLKSVPVVVGDRVVGIVARRDLLRLVARGDHDIRTDLECRLEEELDAGVVTVDGATGPLGRQLLQGLARTVAGVVEVHTSRPAHDGAGRTSGSRS